MSSPLPLAESVLPTALAQEIDSDSSPLTLAAVAGEVSGDMLAALMLQGVQQRWSNVQLQGIGGPAMQQHGFQAWWPSSDLSVRGYVEVLRHYRRISALRKQLMARLLASPPDVFIGVDAPDFNLHVEARLRKQGIATVHFICPSIWAWRGGRVRHLQQGCDRVLCIFPFEVELLQRHGISASYVGHPLARVIAQNNDRGLARQALQLAQSGSVVAVMPGSRASEIQYNAPVFLQTVARLHLLRPDLQFILPAVPGFETTLNTMIAQHCPNAPLKVLQGQSHTALAACDVTLIASGTATLEAALFKRPMVIAYVMHPLSWQMMKRMGYQPWVGLPNILAQRFVVPERLQHAAQPAILARDVLDWLDQPQRVEALQAEFSQMHDNLLRDTPALCAEGIAHAMRRSRGQSA